MRVVANICIINVSRDARRIERNVCSWIDATGIPQFMESFQTCIQRRLSAARKAHDSNPIRIDPRVGSEYGEAPVKIEDHV